MDGYFGFNRFDSCRCPASWGNVSYLPSSNSPLPTLLFRGRKSGELLRTETPLTQVRILTSEATFGFTRTPWSKEVEIPASCSFKHWMLLPQIGIAQYGKSSILTSPSIAPSDTIFPRTQEWSVTSFPPTKGNSTTSDPQ
jgi:hypothetical protein